MGNKKDKLFNCTDCKVRHSIFKNDYFPVILGDQDMISKVPSVDGVCIASCRIENFTMSMLLDDVIFMVTQGAMNDVPPRSNDEFGPVHALEEAIKQG